MNNFNKYQQKGGYHWVEFFSKNPRKLNAYMIARYQKMLTTLPKNATGLKILDIGCGDGLLLYLIANNEPKTELYGIENEKLAIEIAKTKFLELGVGNIKLFVGSAYFLPFNDSFFDVVVSSDVIEHLDDSDGFLREIKRVLKPGGMVLISTPIQTNGLIFDKLHVKEYNLEDLKHIINKFFALPNIRQSHSLIVYRIYQTRLGRIMANILTILGINPFKIPIGRMSYQVIRASKP